MTWRKRLRIVLATFLQEWHEKKCCECSQTWMAVGPDRPELIATCDRCAAEELDRLMAHHEREYRRIVKGVA